MKISFVLGDKYVSGTIVFYRVTSSTIPKRLWNNFKLTKSELPTDWGRAVRVKLSFGTPRTFRIKEVPCPL